MPKTLHGHMRAAQPVLMLLFFTMALGAMSMLSIVFNIIGYGLVYNTPEGANLAPAYLVLSTTVVPIAIFAWGFYHKVVKA